MALVSKSTLADAKAFLCWENFDDLAIQLVPLQQAAAFYVPPNPDVHSILLFYDQNKEDLSEALFLLFHEAGHRRQFEALHKKFDDMTAIPNGPQRQLFEEEAWRSAQLLFHEFITRHNLDLQHLQAFDAYARHAVNSYAVDDNC